MSYRAAIRKWDPYWRREFYCPRASAKGARAYLRRQLPKLWRSTGRLEPPEWARYSVYQLLAEYLERQAEVALRRACPDEWRRVARNERYTRNPLSAVRREIVPPAHAHVQGVLFG